MFINVFSLFFSSLNMENKHIACSGCIRKDYITNCEFYMNMNNKKKILSTCFKGAFNLPDNADTIQFAKKKFPNEKPVNYFYALVNRYCIETFIYSTYNKQIRDQTDEEKNCKWLKLTGSDINYIRCAVNIIKHIGKEVKLRNFYTRAKECLDEFDILMNADDIIDRKMSKKQLLHAINGALSHAAYEYKIVGRGKNRRFKLL